MYHLRKYLFILNLMATTRLKKVGLGLRTGGKVSGAKRKQVEEYYIYNIIHNSTMHKVHWQNHWVLKEHLKEAEVHQSTKHCVHQLEFPST